MATAYWKEDPRQNRRQIWVVKWRDPHGVFVEERRPNDRTKKQAMEYARERERAADLQRKGFALEIKPVTFATLWDSWWKREGSRRRSDSKHGFQASLKKHLSSLRDFVLTPATAGDFAAGLDAILDEREDGKELGPQSLNHLRAGAFRMFEHGRNPKVHLWAGENPIQWVKRRLVPRTRKETLARHEVRPVLDNLPEPKLGAPWRWAAATSLMSSARPGEAFGLRKGDVDIAGGVLTFRYSWTEPLPKDEEPRTVVIVPELKPYLEAAMDSSPNELVFPRADGAPFEGTIRHNLVDHLRRAIVKAGLIIGYEHTCRRCKAKAKKTEEPIEFMWKHQDAVQRRCPSCDMKLWIKALPRPLRFYDLRHTHATLLRRGHVDIGTVSKSMGHSDPRITANTYDHTELEDDRAAIERALTFPPNLGAPVVRQLNGTKKSAPASRISPTKPGPSMVGATGFEPATTCTPSKCATRLRYAPIFYRGSFTDGALMPARPWSVNHSHSSLLSSSSSADSSPSSIRPPLSAAFSTWLGTNFTTRRAVISIG
jgi:integrase